jgi:8-hydroxy-5-deazaflavin:NADPH oxidoreductase
MNVAILGTGNVGKRLGLLMHLQAHNVIYGSRNPCETISSLLHQDAKVVSYSEAIRGMEVIFITTPWADSITLDILETLKINEAQIFVDCTNPLAPDFMSNTIGHTTSAGEQIAEAVKPAKCVKAFNTIFAEIMESGKQQFNGVKSTGFFCGDDETAKHVVKQLIMQAGFEPIDVGAMKNARYLEPMAQLNIQIAYGLQGGTDVAFHYMRRSL